MSKKPENDVSFIVMDHSQKEIEQYQNIHVYKHNYYPEAGYLYKKYFQGIRREVHYFIKYPYIKVNKKTPQIYLKAFIIAIESLFFRLFQKIRTSLSSKMHIGDFQISREKFKTYNKVDADIYIISGVSNLAAEVFAFCRNNNKKSILLLASDNDLSEDYQTKSNEVLLYKNIGQLCHYALKNANCIISQTEYQKTLLKQRFDRESIILRNPLELGDYSEFIPLKDRKTALWVGKSDTIKQPQILIDLAKQFSNQEFTLIMNHVNREIHRKILDHLPPNVIYYEYVSFFEIEKFFSEAFVLINTSVFEGFPNTFLQAGKFGVPILSLKVDPDNFISKNNCGIVANGDHNQFIEGFKQLINNKEKALSYSKNIQNYIKKFHDAKDITNQLQSIISEKLHH
ncbi:MAG: glycosyltransferase [Anaerolineaceae bacterium]|nr:glycosyltransferase [Anaerolineaceae bacterium]